MTIDQILVRIREHRPMSRGQLHRHLKALEISPAGLRQRPQQYPDDSADKMLTALGFEAAANRFASHVPGIVTMKTLRSVRKKARGK